MPSLCYAQENDSQQYPSLLSVCAKTVQLSSVAYSCISKASGRPWQATAVIHAEYCKACCLNKLACETGRACAFSTLLPSVKPLAKALAAVYRVLPQTWQQSGHGHGLARPLPLDFDLDYTSDGVDGAAGAWKPVC